MAKSIRYSIHKTATSSFNQLNNDTLQTNIFSGSDGDVDDAWAALIETDGSGGYIGSDLVHSATFLINGNPDPDTDPYLISPNYDLAYDMSLRITGSSPDPVAGVVDGIGGGGGIESVVGGSGIAVDDTDPANPIVSATGSGLTDVEVTTGTQAILMGNSYRVNAGTDCVLTLPATAAVGEFFEILGINAHVWTVAQRAGQTVYYGDLTTTTGVTGTIGTDIPHGNVVIKCIVANTTFTVISSIGHLETN